MRTIKLFTVFFGIFLITFSATAQRNVNPYKKDKSRAVVVDSKNEYDPTKDINNSKLMLRDTIPSEDFSAYIESVRKIALPYEIDEKASRSKFANISPSTFQKYFDVVNGLGENVLVKPSGGNERLYLVGKLENMPEGITALVFYALDGRIYQYTKLMTFDDAGKPIAHQNIQYNISDGSEQSEKMTCKIGEDNALSCITYGKSDNDEEEGMIKKDGVIYQIQSDGTIAEVGLVDLEEDEE